MARPRRPHFSSPFTVDWNPAGAGILALYKFGPRGTASRRPGADALTLDSLAWVGARAAWFARSPATALTPLTPRDAALASTLAAGPLAGRPAWVAELAAMVAAGANADLEALADGAGLGAVTDLVAAALNAGDWLP